MLVISGLIPIYVQMGLQLGWIKKQPAKKGLSLESVPVATVNLLDKLLDNAGWMVVVGLVLVYFGVRSLGVVVFGAA